MCFGVISESDAREHHAKWHFGEKRAKELWKAHLEELKESGEVSGEEQRFSGGETLQGTWRFHRQM